MTRARPKSDRIIDSDAEILFVPADQVLEVAARDGARSFDAQDAEFTHRDRKCTFEVLIEFGLAKDDPAPAMLARIVHAADTRGST